jgi:catechol 2,3-dioxygenase
MAERLLSQLAHVELLSPEPDETLSFCTEVFGLTEVARDERSVYLRCWGDLLFHSLEVTEAPEAGLGHIAWRTGGPEQLERAVAALEKSGLGAGWADARLGHGPAYRYRGPGGHLQEVFWEVDSYVASPGSQSAFPARPQAHSWRGVAPRQLDHVTVMTRDPYGDSEWYRDTLGYRFMEYTVLDDHPDLVVFSMVTTNEKSHDLGLVVDMSETTGRLHHLAFWVDAVEDVLRAADLLMDSGIHMEFGPGRHGMGEQTYLYFREPAGLRFEVNSGGYRNYRPDWETVRWQPSQGSNTMYRNLDMPQSMMEAFPPAEPVAVAEPELVNPWAHGAN